MTLSNTFPKINVGILGATGMVGQRLVERLHNHPYFNISFLGASERSANKTYNEAAKWRLGGFNPIENFIVNTCEPNLLPSSTPIIFSALDSKVARDIELSFAQKGFLVVSNASAFRMDSNVPLIIPEVNPHHLDLLQKNLAIITNPNCCAIPLALSLAPLQPFGIESICVSTYQSVSGAGYPGESAWDMIGNVHPHAGNEEEKLAIEPQKILGTLNEPASFPISARCVRVPTADGHLLAVQVRLSQSITPEEAQKAFLEYNLPCPQLPSSPTPLFVVHNQRDRPSPRFDVMAGSGMAINIGRIESCNVMTLKYFVLAHNTIRGAAGAAIANAELAVTNKLLQKLGIGDLS